MLAVGTSVLSQSTRYASTGEAATGEVFSENPDRVELNTTPCKSVKNIVVFRKPYTKDSAGTVSCNGTTRSLFQMIQR
jgi:hypothetical protein